jgi:hypothetical protein
MPNLTQPQRRMLVSVRTKGSRTYMARDKQRTAYILEGHGLVRIVRNHAEQSITVTPTDAWANKYANTFRGIWSSNPLRPVETDDQ